MSMAKKECSICLTEKAEKWNKCSICGKLICEDCSNVCDKCGKNYCDGIEACGDADYCAKCKGKKK